MTRSLVLAGFLAFGLPAFSYASSDDAWAEFRADVQAACEALSPKEGTVLVEVNPFGSESYGAAIVYHRTDAGLDRYVCIYDKQSKEAELTAAFPAADSS
ncbi:hypothetical protein [Paracoccus onubensis]|uniref:Uncharacterized protein n=1 Tax=Paracoccus onubensis TaxID=1675788 RepID=A0A418SNX3_9RHOB|nr:hypothetical protein [Paracoccus onubensis]RJE82664.1 hypothetical protein D3P04_18445 [Paracoccus onubensis]